MFTPENYFDIVKGIDFSEMPEAIQQGHNYVVEATDNGQNWEKEYYGGVKETIDIYFNSLQQYLDKKKEKPATSPAKTKSRKAPAATKEKKSDRKNRAKGSNVKATSSRKTNAGKAKSYLPVPEGVDVDKLRINYFRDVKKMSDTELDADNDEIRFIDEEKGDLDEDEKQYKVAVFREINRRLDKDDPEKLYSQDIPPQTNYEQWRIEFRDLNKMDYAELEKESQKVLDVENYNGLTPKEKEYQNKLLKKLNKNAPAALVERIPEEIRFIKRFVNLHNKIKEKDDLLRFINSLQKAILEKRIRKTSSYAEQIRYIQDALIKTYNSMKGKLTMELKPETYEEMKAIAAGEKVMPAINFIKRYIGMNGKTGMKEKARNLLEQIDRALDKGKLKDGEPYMTELHQVQKNLQDFISAKAVRTLEIEKATLNGLQGVLSGCNCSSGLNGLNAPVKKLPSVMNSMDFADVQFRTIGLKGKWLDLIGDPSSNFTAMVFSKPKMGKSYLCVEFAGYLARNHGKVLYVAKEEGLDKTLQQKLNDKNVKHPNLYVAAELPENLAPYDFIFLDSVSRLGLTPEDLRRLKSLYPSKSFIYIFQSTKQGNFRGENAFQHDVDVVIEVPEKGRAVQMGRFNQGGEMEIFDDTWQAA